MDNRRCDGDKQLDVMLAYGPLGLVRATARELHLGGMIVDTGPVTLNEQTEVEVSFTHRHKDEFVTHRISATITDAHHGGATLAFRSYARTTLQVLRVLLEGRRIPDLRPIGALPRINGLMRPNNAMMIPPSGRA